MIRKLIVVIMVMMLNFVTCSNQHRLKIAVINDLHLDPNLPDILTKPKHSGGMTLDNLKPENKAVVTQLIFLGEGWA